MPKPLAQPDKDTGHYCRECPATFMLGDVGSASPHVRYVQHSYFAHRIRSLSAACTNKCVGRATPDERKDKVRHYGPEAVKLEPKFRIEELQSEDEHA